MKTYTVSRRFIVEVSRDVQADSYGSADEKVANKFEMFLKTIPAASLNDWTPLDGGFICEAQEG